jgi:hypothetical protein
MVDKGKKLAEFQHVLRRKENSYNENKVNPQVRIPDVDIPAQQQLVVDVKKDGQEVNGTFEAKRYTAEPGFTIPVESIRELDLHPGESLTFALHEKNVERKTDNIEISDDSRIIDRVSARADPNKSDGMDSRMSSRKVVSYLEQHGGSAQLKFRNVRTKKETTAQTHCQYKDGKFEFHFPIKAREAIDASSDDLIEIINPEATNQIEDNKLNEMYDMISEMYDAYLSAKHD